MRQRFYFPLHSHRWAFLFFCLLVFLLFESSIKFTFYAKEEKVSRKREESEFERRRSVGGGGGESIMRTPTNAMSLSEAFVDAEPNLKSLSASKRDLLITNEIRLNGRLSGIQPSNSDVGRPPSPPQLPQLPELPQVPQLPSSSNDHLSSSTNANQPLSSSDGRLQSSSGQTLPLSSSNARVPSSSGQASPLSSSDARVPSSPDRTSPPSSSDARAPSSPGRTSLTSAGHPADAVKKSDSSDAPTKAAVNISSVVSKSNKSHVTVAFSSPSSAPTATSSPSVRTKSLDVNIEGRGAATNFSFVSSSSSSSSWSTLIDRVKNFISPRNSAEFKGVFENDSFIKSAPSNRAVLLNETTLFWRTNHTSLNHTKALVAGMKPICSQTPPNLVGRVRVDKIPKTLKRLEELHGSGVESGGFYAPPSCLARHRVAIVIPFRDRNEHLHIFLNHMMPFLKKQQLEFAIYVVELAPKEKFNRAMLMNIGFREALRDKDWQCFVFHDVDLLPEIDKNIYSCPANPRHMSAAVDTMNYKLPYHTIFGGVSAFSKEHFQLINGFSNLFFGWGGEDDDLYYRTQKKGLKLTRYPMKIARYTMLQHTKEKPDPDRFQYLKEGTKRMGEDGLNKLNYKLLGTERKKLYTKILVSIDEKAVKKGFPVKKRRFRKKS